MKTWLGALTSIFLLFCLAGNAWAPPPGYSGGGASSTDWPGTLAAPGGSGIGSGTPAAGAFTTLSAGAAGFSVDADGDLICKSVLVTRTNDPSCSTLYEGLDEGNDYVETCVPAAGLGDLTYKFKAPNIYLDRLVATFDGGGAAIAQDKKVYVVIPWDCTVTGWKALGVTSGTINFGVWVDTYANYPPDVGDTVTAAHDPEIGAGTKAQDLDLSDWGDVTWAAGSILAVNVDSNDTVTWASITFHVVKGTIE